MNKTTRAVTSEEFTLIVKTIRAGYSVHRPNERTAAVLVLEANTGMRVGDIMLMKFKYIVKDGIQDGKQLYRLNLTEEKTGKKRTFRINSLVRDFLSEYCRKHGIKDNDIIFPVTERNIQKQLKECVEWLGIDGDIGTHSFRKYAGTAIYKGTGNDLRAVQEFFQHASPATTAKYLAVSSERLNKVIEEHCMIP